MRSIFAGAAVLLLACSAALAARGTNILVSYLLLPELELSPLPAAQGVGGQAQAAIRNFPQTTERNIFAARRSQPDLAVELVGKLSAEEGPVPTSLPLVLVATTVFIPAAGSLATIVDTAASSRGVYSVNACGASGARAGSASRRACNRIASKATLLTIERDRVLLYNSVEDRLEFLAFGHQPPPTPQPSTAAGKTRPDSFKVRKLGQNRYEIDRAEADRLLADPNAAGGVRVVPATEQGKIAGFRLFSIRPQSFYSALGLQNGDVLTRVNGYALDDPSRLLELYSKLSEASELSVDLKRRGAPVTLELKVR